jgi:hypothetical protein
MFFSFSGSQVSEVNEASPQQFLLEDEKMSSSGHGSCVAAITLRNWDPIHGKRNCFIL